MPNRAAPDSIPQFETSPNFYVYYSIDKK